MDKKIYTYEAAAMNTNWWYLGRQNLFSKTLCNLKLSPNSSFLDVGTSAGVNLLLLKSLRFENFAGIDFSDEAVALCHSIGLSNVKQADATLLPYDNESFDFVFATDVIEHLDNDNACIREVYRVLKPDGWALFTVPAFMSLWSENDIQGHHKRRYRIKELRNQIIDSKFTIKKSYYFNFLLFIPILIMRKILFYIPFKSLKNETKLVNPFINLILKWIFKLDIFLAPLIAPPFGVSILILAQKRRS